MTKIEHVVKELSEMYDIYMEFRRARAKAGMPMGSPIAGMTLEEFEEMRRKYLEEIQTAKCTKEEEGRKSSI